MAQKKSAILIVERYCRMLEGGPGSTRWGDRVPQERSSRSPEKSFLSALGVDHTPAVKVIHENTTLLWEKTKGSHRENCVVVAKDGSKHTEKEGDEHYIPFTDEEADAMQHQHLVHTHPNQLRTGVPTGFSEADIGFAVTNNLASISAVSAQGTFIFVRPKEGWLGGGRHVFPQVSPLGELLGQMEAVVLADIPADFRKTLSVHVLLKDEMNRIGSKNMKFYTEQRAFYRVEFAAGRLKRTAEFPKDQSDDDFIAVVATQAAYSKNLAELCENHNWETKFIPAKGKKTPSWVQKPRKNMAKTRKYRRLITMLAVSSTIAPSPAP